MTRSFSKTLLDMAELRAGSVITEREISALKKRWRPRPSKINASRLDPYTECEEFMEHGPYCISREQGDKGISYLRNLILRKDGELRRAAWVRDNNICEFHAEVLRDFSHFELVDWQWDTNNYGTSWPFPVYRAYSKAGEVFDYIARPWQSGQSEVLT